MNKKRHIVKILCFFMLISFVMILSSCGSDDTKQPPAAKNSTDAIPYMSLGITPEKISKEFKNPTDIPLDFQVNSEINTYTTSKDAWFIVAGELNAKDKTIFSLRIFGTFDEKDTQKSDIYTKACISFIEFCSTGITASEANTILKTCIEKKAYIFKKRSYVFSRNESTSVFIIQPSF